MKDVSPTEDGGGPETSGFAGDGGGRSDVCERRHVYLVGFMGAGKSTVGRLLAQKLGRRWVDMDAEIGREAQKSVAAIFAAEGEGVSPPRGGAPRPPCGRAITPRREHGRRCRPAAGKPGAPAGEWRRRLPRGPLFGPLEASHRIRGKFRSSSVCTGRCGSAAPTTPRTRSTVSGGRRPRLREPRHPRTGCFGPRGHPQELPPALKRPAKRRSGSRASSSAGRSRGSLVRYTRATWTNARRIRGR